MYIPKSLDERTIAENAESVRFREGLDAALDYVKKEYELRKAEGRTDSPKIGKEFKEMLSGTHSDICILDEISKDKLGDCTSSAPVDATQASYYHGRYGANQVNKKEKKENKMSYASATLVNTVAELPTDQKQRKYLAQRADEVYSAKKDEARKTFGLVDTPQPKTVGEFIQFIKDDKFTVEERYLDRKLPYTGCAPEYIRFRDPTIKEDQAGYDAFKDAASKALKTLKDDIVILDPKEGLEKLREFEAATFH